MNSNARITIITVVLNGAGHLENTIRSVIENRTKANIDHIVIDGGSTDGTVDLLRRYDSEINYWVSERDSGIYDAMNKGWVVAAEDSLVLFLGAGDRLVSVPDKIEQFNKKDVIYGNVLVENGKAFKPKAGIHLKLYNSLHHQALLIRRSCHPDPPFDIRYKIYADFDFNQRLLKNGVNFIYSPSFTSYASPGGVSGQPCFAESLKVIKKNFGYCWMLLAVCGFVAMRTFPGMKRFHPIQQLS